MAANYGEGRPAVIPGRSAEVGEELGRVDDSLHGVDSPGDDVPRVDSSRLQRAFVDGASYGKDWGLVRGGSGMLEELGKERKELRTLPCFGQPTGRRRRG